MIIIIYNEEEASDYQNDEVEGSDYNLCVSYLSHGDSSGKYVCHFKCVNDAN